MSCTNSQALFTKGNKNQQVNIGAYWSRIISVTVDDVSRVYDDITLSGCISAKDLDGAALEIPIDEQGDDLTTGVYKIPAVLPATDITKWKFVISVATGETIKEGVYDFVIFGTPLDTKKYVELSGKIEFLNLEDC